MSAIESKSPQPPAAILIPPPAHDDELHCPLCDYNLHGLSENRCPECGHAYDPEQLRAAKLARKRWLFEHAEGWRRVIASFFSTAARTVRPVYFWGNVSAADRIVPRRLARWGIAWALLAFLGMSLVMTSAVTLIYWRWNANASTYASQLMAQMGGTVVSSTSTTVTLNFNGRIATIPLPPRLSWWDTWPGFLRSARLANDVPLAIALVAWPIFVLLGLRVFGATLRRAGIRSGHLWRCVLYPWPVTCLLPAVLAASFACFTRFNYADLYDFRDLLPLPVSWILWTRALNLTAAPVLTLTLMAALTTVHLVAAHVRYLRLRHAAVQAILVQIVAWLGMVAVIFYTGELWKW